MRTTKQTRSAPDQQVRITLSAADGEETDAPRQVYEIVEQALPLVAEGKDVAVVEVSHGLTTQEAAEILGCSRPHLIGLLDAGDIPHYKVGTHRRIRVHDVVEYKRRRDENVHAALDEIVGLSQDMGLY